jgi:hypothetical protein
LIAQQCHSRREHGKNDWTYGTEYHTIWKYNLHNKRKDNSFSRARTTLLHSWLHTQKSHFLGGIF